MIGKRNDLVNRVRPFGVVSSDDLNVAAIAEGFVRLAGQIQYLMPEGRDKEKTFRRLEEALRACRGLDGTRGGVAVTSGGSRWYT